MTVAMSAIPTTMPTTMPTARTGSLCRPPSFHDRALDRTNARLSDRPVVAMPTRPTPMANHGVVPPWEKALSICSASEPERPTSDAAVSTPAQGPTRPATPTLKSTRGTKKRNNRSASALPNNVPAASLSRSYTRMAKSTTAHRSRRSAKRSSAHRASSSNRVDRAGASLSAVYQASPASTSGPDASGPADSGAAAGGVPADRRFDDSGRTSHTLIIAVADLASPASPCDQPSSRVCDARLRPSSRCPGGPGAATGNRCARGRGSGPRRRHPCRRCRTPGGRAPWRRGSTAR